MLSSRCAASTLPSPEERVEPVPVQPAGQKDTAVIQQQHKCSPGNAGSSHSS